MEDWSKLEGKKIIMLGCDDLNSVLIGVIVGCDPDIGICIADPDDLKTPGGFVKDRQLLDLIDSFDWSKTRQGYEFWEYVLEKSEGGR